LAASPKFATELPYNADINLATWRSGEYVRQMCMHLDAINCAMIVAQGQAAVANMTGKLDHLGNHVGFKLPHMGFLKAVILQQQEPEITVQILPNPQATATPLAEGPHAINTNVLNAIRLWNDPIANQFVFFYERYIDFVKAAANHAVPNFERRWGFGRVVRNAITHGGTINIDDAGFNPVSWMGLTLGHANRGEVLVGSKLHGPDLIYLMLDMDLALTALGHV
jgi:hypothetical protein